MVQVFYSVIQHALSYLPLFQRPSGVPGDTGKLELDSWANIILYVILPITIIVLYVIWKKNKSQSEDKEN